MLCIHEGFDGWDIRIDLDPINKAPNQRALFIQRAFLQDSPEVKQQGQPLRLQLFTCLSQLTVGYANRDSTLYSYKSDPRRRPYQTLEVAEGVSIAIYDEILTRIASLVEIRADNSR